MFFFLNSFVKKNQDYVGTGREGKGRGGEKKKGKNTQSIWSWHAHIVEAAAAAAWQGWTGAAEWKQDTDAV